MSGVGSLLKAGIALGKTTATTIAAGTKSASSLLTTAIKPSLSASKSIGTGATTIAKGSDDVALAATKAGAAGAKASDDVALAATKAGAAGGGAGVAKVGLTTGAKNADEAAEAAIKNADDAAINSAKQAGKQTDEVVKAKAGMLSKVATVGSVAVSALALKSYFEKNGKLYNIISIDDVSDDTNIKTQITIFSGRDEFSKNDTIEIKDTDCVPDITGSYGIFEKISNDKYIITTPSKITTKGTKGEVKLLTTFENVFADTLKDALGNTAGVAKSGVGAILEGLGISPENMWIIIGVVAAIIICLILWKIFR